MSIQKIYVIQQLIFALKRAWLTSTLFMVLCLTLLSIKSYSQERKHILRNDTTIMVGLKTVRFKGRTEITIKDKKIVLSGVLANDIDHSSAARRNVALKAGTKVTFDEKGNVLSGTLKKVNRLVSFSLPKSPLIGIQIMEDKNFSLYSDGSLKSGTLKEIYNFKLTPSGIALLFFTKSGEVVLRENGTLKSGYLNTTRQLKTANQFIYYFKGWCFVEFNEKGELVKGEKIIGDPNGRHSLESVEVIGGKLQKSSKDFPCVCAF